jgi:YggT family protein
MSGMGIDFSPIIVILAIIFLQAFLVNSIGMLAMQLQ